MAEVDLKELWQRPEAKAMTMRHTRERLLEGVYREFHKIMPLLLADMGWTNNFDIDEIRMALHPELPVALVADSWQDDSDECHHSVQFADPLALMKINLDTGKPIGPFIPIGNIEGGVLIPYEPDEMGGFALEQQELLFRQANEQTTAGLPPHLVFENRW